jgi:1,4-dihydroxy-2-naphthoyl-CoA hydrolase
MTARALEPDHFNNLDKVYLPEFLGIKITEVEPSKITAILRIEQHHLAPNGYTHAGSVITLADTAAGYGCLANLPDGAENFTTIELKSNFLGTVRDGTIICVAELVHGGRTTQVWDAVAKSQETGKTLAMFRCTQMILYPR